MCYLYIEHKFCNKPNLHFTIGPSPHIRTYPQTSQKYKCKVIKTEKVTPYIEAENWIIILKTINWEITPIHQPLICHL